jgi:hypothetical protein
VKCLYLVSPHPRKIPCTTKEPSSTPRHPVNAYGTFVFLLNSVIALYSGGIAAVPVANSVPSPQVAQKVAAVAERMHATLGYAQYWDAANITWLTGFRVVIAPFVGCGVSTSRLCPGPNDFLEEWYRPEPRRTFLLSDTTQSTWAPSASLGRAIATYHFGTITMYVYNHDVVESLLA